MNRADFENLVAQLNGRTILDVSYVEVDTQNDHWYFFDDPRFDSIDFGLQLSLDRGDVLSITWGSEFVSYGLSLQNRPFSEIVWNGRTLNVSESKRWTHIIGQTVTATRVSWSWLGHYEFVPCKYNPLIQFLFGSWLPTKTEKLIRVYFPKDLLLRFSNDRLLVISALEIRDSEPWYPCADNITVFDDLQTAKDFDCCNDCDI